MDEVISFFFFFYKNSIETSETIFFNVFKKTCFGVLDFCIDFLSPADLLTQVTAVYYIIILGVFQWDPIFKYVKYERRTLEHWEIYDLLKMNS